MRAGRLRERVTIQQATVTRDAHGGQVLTWATYSTVWASVLPGGSGERFLSGADQRQATIDYAIRARYLAGVGPTMRVVWGTRALGIQSVVDPDGRRAEMVLLCQDIGITVDAIVETVYSLDFSDSDMSMYLGAI